MRIFHHPGFTAPFFHKASIRKLKATAAETDAAIWPNHDMAFWRTLKRFPEYHA